MEREIKRDRAMGQREREGEGDRERSREMGWGERKGEMKSKLLHVYSIV